jgi:hypothetical protein
MAPEENTDQVDGRVTIRDRGGRSFGKIEKYKRKCLGWWALWDMA